MRIPFKPIFAGFFSVFTTSTVLTVYITAMITISLLPFCSFQINTVLFIFLLRRISRVTKFREVNMARANHMRAWIRRSVMLLPVLGVTWSFGFFTFVSSTVVFHYLFTILNSLQGFFIFLNFCVLDDRVSCPS